jgi:hypothetical protein
MRELTRREALAGATALGAVAVAGCVSNSDDDEDPASNDPETSTSQDNGEDAGEEQETPLELLGTELTANDGSCGSGDQVEATVTDGDVTLSGKIPASNPCHEAVLRDGTMEDGSLSMTVEVESTSGEGESCAQCLGVVDYEATLEFSEDLTDLSALSSLTVEHGGRSGETHTIEEAGVVSGRVSLGEDGSRDGATGEAVLADSIVTTERGCTGNIPPSGELERESADEETSVSQSDNTVTVQGSLTASTPCHEANLERVSYDGGVLSLAVGTESNLDSDEMCVECLAELEYEATVEVADGVAVEDVSVAHIQRS